MTNARIQVQVVPWHLLYGWCHVRGHCQHPRLDASGDSVGSQTGMEFNPSNPIGPVTHPLYLHFTINADHPQADGVWVFDDLQRTNGDNGYLIVPFDS